MLIEEKPNRIIEDYRVGKEEEYLTEIQGDKKKKKEQQITD